ncbi:MAG: hypothetical protein J7K26_02370 [Candidatus Aenigmarchaeota archaeon]|nr:hypothetical protein [Candidatus Aenigmarchaeota archaeon]
MKKLVFLSILALMLISPVCLASNFTIGVTKSSQYLAGRTGVIDLTITNNGPKDIFSISILGTPSGWLTSEYSGIELDKNETKKINIYVTPPKDASPKLYEYFITVRSTNTNEKIEKQLILNIQQNASIIISDVSLNCTSCIDNVKISGFVENSGTVDFSNVDLKLSLEDQETTIPIGELLVKTKKYFENVFLLDNYRPGSYNIKLEVLSNNKLVYNDVKQFNIQTIKNIAYSNKSSKTIFGKFVTLKAINKGNDIDTAVFESSLDKSWYVFYAGPKGEVTNNKISWKTDIDAGETIEIKYSEIYWPTYIIIISAVLIGLFLYLTFTSLAIRKSIAGRNIVEKDKSMSVSITVKNRIREMTNVVVKDFIPKEFEILGKFETIKPILRKTSNGIELTWKLGRLKSYEQRILHYKIKPKKLIKKMNLPSATVTAKYFNKTIIKKSNRVAVYSKKNIPSTLAVEISE